MISTPVLLAVLGSALLHAGWNFLVKASGERLLDTATLALGGSLLAAFLLPWVSLPASASLPWLAISVLIHVAYFVALIDPTPPRGAPEGDGRTRGAHGLHRDQRPQPCRQQAAAGGT